MATPPNPRIYMADDWSWAAGGSTAWENFYVWDGHGSLGRLGYGTGVNRGFGFVGETSSGKLGWTLVDLDTLFAISTSTVGQCFGFNPVTAAGGNLPICQFHESAAGVVHVIIFHDSTGHIAAKNGDGTLLGTSSYIMGNSASTGPTHHVEVHVTVHSTAGTVTIWVDDILVLALTGKNTRNGGGGTIGYLLLDAAVGRHFAEWFVHDASARLGSQWRVGYVPVSADGTYSNGTAVGAATGLQAVDDSPSAPELEDTTYHVLDATGTPKKSSWQSGPMPTTAKSIRDVHPQIVIEKSDGGTNTAKTGLKSGATEVYTTNAYGVPDAWAARRLALRTDPASGTPLWTLITAAASEIIVDRLT